MRVKITAHKDGYARAGLRHTKRGRIHDVADLTEDQRAILAADPNLRIIPVHDDGDPVEPGSNDGNPPSATGKRAPRAKAGA